MNRRQFLAAVSLTGLATACGQGGSRAPANPAAFRTALPVPPLLEPRTGADGVRRFALTMRRGRAELLPGRPVKTWGFNGPHLGPTLRAARGDRVAMTVANRLGEASTVHWHGMRLPAKMDGGPHQMIEPGATWRPHWTIDQPAATAWYHPHPHGRTAAHVYRGLAGLFIIDDRTDADLPAEYGVDDVPLILQDKELDETGAPTGDPLKGTFGILGGHILVNGVHAPRLDVRTRLVRFRVLNGSNARRYRLAFADGRAFHVVGNDAGLLPAPAEVEQVPLSPGERVEIVVAFAPGDEAMLLTRSGSHDVDEGDFDILKIVAAARLAPSRPLPARLADPAPIAVPPGARVRRFRLEGHDAINGREMDIARIDEVVPAGAVEVWEIENYVYAHNFHIHEVAFQVLEVAGKKPPAYMAGRKDTVYLPPKSKARLAVQFGTHTDPGTPYMYHCHILRHEDSGMMGQFVIVRPGTERSVPRRIAAPGGAHGHGH
ncbi:MULTISPECIES: multicopper oxidase family protein [Actinomadura]|uniref:multicopper oxidase family protein n=1 Tax=Actinomadura TaxID=1988 RepID=UPI000429D392|nr:MULTISPECIES: multicopper oxidase domain-containing protein [Actinomadura]RSN51409.1 copper oxidase [Actinomadura sp. WAC 06369]